MQLKEPSTQNGNKLLLKEQNQAFWMVHLYRGGGLAPIGKIWVKLDFFFQVGINIKTYLKPPVNIKKIFGNHHLPPCSWIPNGPPPLVSGLSLLPFFPFFFGTQLCLVKAEHCEYQWRRAVSQNKRRH